MDGYRADGATPRAAENGHTSYHVPMQCNIDAKGKSVRLISGIIVTLLAVILLALRGVGVVTGTWPWIVGGLLLAMGAFQIFEARAGWCVVRAMGFKTRV